jgi:conjugal transfer pilus assembly protein TraW
MAGVSPAAQTPSVVQVPPVVKDHGVHGQTFEIQERSLLEVILSRLKKAEKDGTLLQHQQMIAEKMKKKVHRPTPVGGIQKAQENKRHTFDPTMTFPEDIKDHEGRLIVKAGTRINPLDYIAVRVPLLFFDGDDEAQVAWAKRQHKQAKWILVNGAPIALGEQEDRPVYFDQGGTLTKKFGIDAVPARLTQENKLLLIEEEVV